MYAFDAKKVFVVAFIAFLIVPVQAEASLRLGDWIKDGENPIIGPAGDETHAYVPSAVRVSENDWRMLFKSEGGGFDCLKYASSTDGSTWTRQNSDECVISPAGGGWETAFLRNPRLFYDGTTYHALFVANDSSNITRPGYATSTDMINWTKSPSNPIMNPADFSWTVQNIWIHDVVIKDSVWHFFGQSWNGGANSKLWMSKGTGWTDPDSVAAPTEIITPSTVGLNEESEANSNGFFGQETVFKIGSTYYLFYAAEIGSEVHIHWATSPDLTTWTKQDNFPEVLPLGGSGAWDECMVFAPRMLKESQEPYAAPLEVGSNYHLFYSGRDSDCSTSRSGAAHISISDFVEVLSGGLRGYWKLDETSAGSTVADSSPYENDGTPQGTVKPQPSADVAADFAFANARSLEFDGDDDYINFGDVLDQGTDDFTTTAWINVDDYDNFGPVLTKSSGGDGFAMMVNKTTGELRARIGSTVGNVSGVIGTGEWKHIAITWDRDGNATGYIDGVQGSTIDISSSSGSISDTNDLRIGALDDGAGTNLFDGKIDEVRLYNRLLSSSEIAALAAKNHTSATWDGSSGTDWTTAANWNINAIPDNFTNLTIADTANDPVVAANLTVSDLTLSSDATLDLSSFNLTLNDSGSFSNNGTLKLQGGNTLTGFTNDTNSGTVEYTGTDSYSDLAAGDNYYNLIFSGAGTWTLDAAADVNGAFSLLSGTLAQSSHQMNVAGNVRIADGTTFTKSTNGSLLVLDGDLTLENETTANLGVLQIGTSPDTTTLSGSIIVDELIIASGDQLTTNGFDVTVGTDGITNSGTLLASSGTTIATASGVLNHGTWTANNSQLTLSGALTNNGTFSAGTGTVTLNGTNQTLNGSTTFYNLTKTITSADTLTFSAGDTFTIGNTLTLQGTGSNLLSLRSSTSGTQWKINPQGTRTISYLDVKDSNNTNATAIDATGGTHTDSGNNTNWTFLASSSSSSSSTSNTDTGSQTPSGGSPGGSDSATMQAKIATAHERILARFSGAPLIATAPPSQSDNVASSDEQPVHSRSTALEEIATRRNILLAHVNEQSILYADVPRDAWFTPYVSFVIEEQIAQGYRNDLGELTGEFGVANPITRAEILKMALEANPASTEKRVAVPRNPSARGTWASSYVAQAENLQLSIFAPAIDVHQPASRAEVIQTILEVLNLPTANQSPSFVDVSADHPQAGAIATAHFYGIISGDDGTNTFRPDDYMNRAEVAKTIALLQEILGQ